MFTWIGNQITSTLSTYVLGVVTALMAALTPVALSAMTLWVGLYGWAVLRHEVSESVPTFLWKVFKIGLVIAFALQASIYMSNVATTADDLAMGVARTFLPASSAPSAVSSPYALLDAFNDQASQLVVDLMTEAGITRLDLFLAATICAVGNVVFLCIALFVVTLSKMVLAFVLAVGPVFLLALAWRPTARFFDSWLSMLLNAIVLTWFAFFALGLSVYMGQAMVQAANDHGGFAGGTFNVVGESLRYCVVMVLLAIVCFQAPGLAAALTGGAAVHQGVQMVQNAIMFTSLRSSTTASRADREIAAGGVIRSGGGLPYAAGRALSRSALAAKSVLADRSVPRAPAYRRAAERGSV